MYGVESACRWIKWNDDHATKHGVAVGEIEDVVYAARQPRYEGDGKYKVIGRGAGGRWVQVIFLYDPEPEDTIYVIHAPPMVDREKRRERRRRR